MDVQTARHSEDAEVRKMLADEAEGAFRHVLADVAKDAFRKMLPRAMSITNGRKAGWMALDGCPE